MLRDTKLLNPELLFRAESLSSGSCFDMSDRLRDMAVFDSNWSDEDVVRTYEVESVKSDESLIRTYVHIVVARSNYIAEGRLVKQLYLNSVLCRTAKTSSVMLH